jgi:4,5-dihydroxyphthalate decarboxylase
LPIFLMRRFPHSGIVCRRDAGIKSQGSGGKIGRRLGYSGTTGVGTRGILADEYGLDLSKVTWVVDDEEPCTQTALTPETLSMSPPAIACRYDGKRRAASRLYRQGGNRRQGS